MVARGQGGGPPPWGELGGGACEFASPHATHLAKSDGTNTHDTGMAQACLVSIGRPIRALAEKWPRHLRIMGPPNHPFSPTTGSKLNGFTRDLDHAPCNGVGMPTINFGANRTSWEQAAGPLPPPGHSTGTQITTVSHISQPKLNGFTRDLDPRPSHDAWVPPMPYQPRGRPYKWPGG